MHQRSVCKRPGMSGDIALLSWEANLVAPSYKHHSVFLII